MKYSQLEILLNVAVAMLLGALIGLDLEAVEKPAGLRTHILVSGGACMLILLSFLEVLASWRLEAADQMIVSKESA